MTLWLIQRKRWRRPLVPWTVLTIEDDQPPRGDDVVSVQRLGTVPAMMIEASCRS